MDIAHTNLLEKLASALNATSPVWVPVEHWRPHIPSDPKSLTRNRAAFGRTVEKVRMTPYLGDGHEYCL